MDKRITRRAALRAAGAATAGLGPVAGCLAPDEGTDPAESVGAEQVASGFTAPVGLEVAPGSPERYDVVDQTGQVRVVDGDGVRDDPFLDVTDRMVDLGTGYDERGLLGLAFHPRFGENRRLYVRYSAPPRPGTGADHTFVLAEFRATEDGLGVVEGSERVVLALDEPQSNHNAGAVAFGPEGYLYVGTGDGGGAGDRGPGHVSDWYAPLDGGNGQDVTENLLGSVLRVDVDTRGNDRGYGVPPDNPLVGTAGRDEHYAWGFRNPWRMSFDGDRLLVADVGQNRYEEVDRVVRGGNYGWNVREGAHCYGRESCPSETPDGDPLRDPVVEYPHEGAPVSGVAVIGGYVYRGESLPLAGDYLFADWAADGDLFVATPREEGQWPVEVVSLEAAGGPAPGPRVLAFGRDGAGELYVCTSERAGLAGDTGAVHRLVPA